MKPDFISHVKNGILYDDLWEPLRKTTKVFKSGCEVVPKGSSVCYVISDGGPVHTIFSTRKVSKQAFFKERKTHDTGDINLIMTWVDPKGNFITSEVIG